jgi:hypothetical protein
MMEGREKREKKETRGKKENMKDLLPPGQQEWYQR